MAVIQISRFHYSHSVHFLPGAAAEPFLWCVCARARAFVCVWAFFSPCSFDAKQSSKYASKPTVPNDSIASKSCHIFAFQLKKLCFDFTCLMRLNCYCIKKGWFCIPFCLEHQPNRIALASPVMVVCWVIVLQTPTKTHQVTHTRTHGRAANSFHKSHHAIQNESEFENQIQSTTNARL